MVAVGHLTVAPLVSLYGCDQFSNVYCSRSGAPGPEVVTGNLLCYSVLQSVVLALYTPMCSLELEVVDWWAMWLVVTITSYYNVKSYVIYEGLRSGQLQLEMEDSSSTTLPLEAEMGLLLASVVGSLIHIVCPVVGMVSSLYAVTSIYRNVEDGS